MIGSLNYLLLGAFTLYVLILPVFQAVGLGLILLLPLTNPHHGRALAWSVGP